MIEFRLDTRSGVPTYLQIVQQVKRAAQLGLLQPGDKLPTVKDVVGQLAINPNMVLKAYRELDLMGLTEGRRGQGTFLSADVASPRFWSFQLVEAGLFIGVSAALLAFVAHRVVRARTSRPCAPGGYRASIGRGKR